MISTTTLTAAIAASSQVRYLQIWRINMCITLRLYLPLCFAGAQISVMKSLQLLAQRKVSLKITVSHND